MNDSTNFCLFGGQKRAQNWHLKPHDINGKKTIFIGLFLNLLRTFRGMRNMGGVGDAMDFRKSNAKVFEVDDNVLSSLTA